MNPVRQVSMDILLKCEAALKKMEKVFIDTMHLSKLIFKIVPMIIFLIYDHVHVNCKSLLFNTAAT